MQPACRNNQNFELWLFLKAPAQLCGLGGELLMMELVGSIGLHGETSVVFVQTHGHTDLGQGIEPL